MSTPATTTPNANETALHTALAAHPGSTASYLAYIAEMSVSTARSILSRWAADGTAVRTSNPDAPRAGYRWALATDTAADTAPGPAPAAPAPEPATPDTAATPPDSDGGEPAGADPQATDAAPASGPAPAPAAGSGSTPAQRTKPEKLPSGGLRGMVEDFLRDNPGQDFSPTALKHRLDDIHQRDLSSGAINNALEKLTTLGIARRTSDAPKKWALADGA
ncbi:hypothetical protein [Nocardia terpenica]|uniref:hypothetical protein n=1 Tax=Nocardia terpenica TaxID=455432 RepID=UPI0015C53775|nr:hypothetical protein [Nocardia terpenica]NQE89482.1 hypothetical protein [Nocardia terpenica]